jgi:DNA polymerase III alpha subunit (gram-positive type)
MGRIELHAKTNMSFMDGIADCRHLVRTAFAMGLTAVCATVRRDPLKSAA